MFLSFRTGDADPGPFRMHHGSTAGGQQYVIVWLGDGIDLHLRSAADCDALITAASEAKRLLAPPVITDSETCDQKHPGTGDRCLRGGDHGVHRDAYGGEWRTDTAAPGCGAPHPRMGLECASHRGGMHVTRRPESGSPEIGWPIEPAAGEGGLLIGPFEADDAQEPATREYRNPFGPDGKAVFVSCQVIWGANDDDSVWSCTLPEGHAGQHQAWSICADMPFAVIDQVEAAGQ